MFPLRKIFFFQINISDSGFTAKRGRWMNDAIFASFSSVFPPYQNDGMVIMKSYVQWNSI